MKTIRLFTTLAAVAMLTLGTQAYAQSAVTSGPAKGHGLNDEQKTKIKDIKMASFKETKPLNSKLAELKVHQGTLMMADKADMNAINANIDEIAKLESQIAKNRAAGVQQVRGLLTDEQRMAFDRKMMAKKSDNMKMRHPAKRNLRNDSRGPKGPRVGAEVDNSTSETSQNL